MSDAAMWREKAGALRESAEEMDDSEQKNVLLTLAIDCDELAIDREHAALAAPKAG